MIETNPHRDVPRVLLAMPDALERKTVGASLRSRGFTVTVVADGDAAVSSAQLCSPDVVLIDLELVAGFDELRGLTDAYVIGIAPPDADGARVRALRAGADDAISVPFDVEELLARCEALLRRPREVHARWDPFNAWLITLGPLTMDMRRREIRVRDRKMPVTRLEFAVLEQLCLRPDEVCERRQLLTDVWGPGWAESDTHIVDVHISNLRRKLWEHAPDRPFIETVRGVGFRLSDDLALAQRAG